MNDMYEMICRKFYPDNREEDINIRMFLKEVKKMNGFDHYIIRGLGDYHHIEAYFRVNVPELDKAVI